MIEPQSAQLGASAWVWKLTFVAPRFSVMADVPPFPLPALLPPFVACPLPLVAMTASSSRGADSAATAVALGASESVEDWASEAVGGDAASEVSGITPSPTERVSGAAA